MREELQLVHVVAELMQVRQAASQFEHTLLAVSANCPEAQDEAHCDPSQNPSEHERQEVSLVHVLQGEMQFLQVFVVLSA